jgi:hypothetical protein
MLATPTFDADRLVSPRGTCARVDAAGVLEHVGPAARALHFDRFAVVQIGHVWFSKELKRGGIGECATRDHKKAIGKQESPNPASRRAGRRSQRNGSRILRRGLRSQLENPANLLETGDHRQPIVNCDGRRIVTYTPSLYMPLFTRFFSRGEAQPEGRRGTNWLLTDKPGAIEFQSSLGRKPRRVVEVSIRRRPEGQGKPGASFCAQRRSASWMIADQVLQNALLHLVVLNAVRRRG